MNTRQQHGEPEQREGLGGRVRRFIDNELAPALNKEDRGATDDRRHPDPAPEPDQTTEFDDRAARPATTPTTKTMTVDPEPVDPGYDSPVRQTVPAQHTVGTQHPVVDSPEQPPIRSSDQTAADGNAQRVGLLDDPAGLRDEWQRVQGTFVDDPQRAVHQASMLVEQTLQEIRKNVTRGQSSDPTSTEDLRVSFQRYREFFQRLLSA
jgi:hypothetical protein